MPLEALIGAGASLLSGVLGNKSKRDAGDANAELQREFAQHGVRWKVADAKAAGIHPLAVLGGNMPSPSPSYIADDYSYVADMGQNIQRAIAAGSTQEERNANAGKPAPNYPSPEDSAGRLQLDALALERAALNNELLRTQIASERAKLGPEQLGPAFPSAGGSPAQRFVEMKPPEQEPTKAATPGSNESVNPATRWIRTETGVVPYPGKQFIDDVELENPYAAEYWFRNRLGPALGLAQPHGQPPHSMLPSWADGWKYHTLSGEWRPDNKRSRERIWGKDPWHRGIFNLYREPPT